MEGRHILITGGSAGIGKGIAEKLHGLGATVHLTGRRAAPLEAVAAELGERVTIHPGDIAVAEDRQALLTAVIEAGGRKLDGLVLNAASYRYQPLLETREEDFRADVEINLMAPFAITKAFVPLLRAGDGKSIVFISSTLGARPVPGAGAYAATKAGLDALTKTFALELAPEGIRVNGIAPGVVDTPIHDPRADGDPSRAEKMTAFAAMHPLGRVGKPSDIAEAAAYLLGSGAGWVTGSLVQVDGGISIA